MLDRWRPWTGRLVVGLAVAVVCGAVAAAAAWALVADGKDRWATVAGTVAAGVGFAAPLVLGAVRAAATRRAAAHRAARVVAAGELPESVAWLLHPAKAVVAFFGREQALARLEAWCGDQAAPVVRLVTAPGGYGKTRLARELCVRLTGWDPLWVAVGKEAETAGLLPEAGGRRLLVVDYADSRDPAGLAELLAAAARAPRPVRVLALARTAGPWWASLSASCPPHAALVDALTVTGNVTALDARADDRSPDQIVASAAAQFAEHLKYPPPPPGSRSVYPPGTALLRLHAEALLAVLDGQPSHERADGVITELLQHEQRYWRGCARRTKVPLPDDPHEADQLLRRVAGVAALLGASDTEEVTGLVRRALDADPAAPPPAPAWERWLADLYPHDGGGGTPGRLGTLQPDLLGETLAVQTLTAYTDRHRAAVFTGLSPTQAVRALTVLGRATAHQPAAPRLIDTALGADLRIMAGAVVAVARQFPGLYAPRLAALIPGGGLTLARLHHLHEQLPYRSHELNPVALAITTTALDRLSGGTLDPQRATWWGSHAVRLAQAGRRDEALAAVEEAVRLDRELVGLDRDAFLPDLAGSVNNHAIRLAEVGRRGEALAASEEAVRLYRELVGLDRDAFLPDLAGSVNNHAIRLAEVGRRAEALAPAEEAVRLYRELVGLDRDTFLPDLAMSVSNHAADLAEVGRLDEALAASEEAVRLRRELAGLDRDAFLADLAGSVNNHAADLADVGRLDEALAASEEALRLRRELAGLNRDAYLPDLAMSVNNHAIRLAEVGRRGEALAASEEAVRLRRELADVNRDAYLPDLATSLWNVGGVCVEVDAASQHAIDATAEAVRLFEELATAEPAAFSGRLRAAVATLATLYEAMGDGPAAEAVRARYRVEPPPGPS